MGIKGLQKVLSKNGYTPEEYTPKKLDIRGKYIGIDTSIFLYKYISVFQEQFLYGFLKQIIYIVNNGGTPVYIFDGKPTEDKEELIKKRKKAMDKNKEQVREQEALLYNNGEDVMTPEQRKNLEKKKKRIVIINDERINKLKKMLRYFGITHIHYDGEADLYLRHLFNEKLIDIVISNDMDLLTHGSKVLLHDFNTSAKKMKLFYIEKILETLDITHKQFVDLCILLGCDYTGTVKGIGPVSALKFIKKYNSIEGIKENQPKFDYETMDYETARNMFTCEVNHDRDYTRKDFKIKFSKKKEDKITKFIQDNEVKVKGKKKDNLIKEAINAFIKTRVKTLV